MIRLFIVHDYAVLCEGLRPLLERGSDLITVGEAINGQHLLDQRPTISADVVLFAPNMPVLNSLATAKHLHASYFEVQMLSMVKESLGGTNQLQKYGCPH